MNENDFVLMSINVKSHLASNLDLPFLNIRYIMPSLNEYLIRQKKRKNGPLMRNKNSFVFLWVIKILSSESVSCFFRFGSASRLSTIYDFSLLLNSLLCSFSLWSNDLTLNFDKFLKTLSLSCSANLRLAAGDWSTWNTPPVKSITSVNFYFQI